MPNQISETRVLVEVEENIALPGNGEHSQLVPQKLCVPTWCGEREEEVRSSVAMIDSRAGDKDQIVFRACIILVWPQVMS